MNAFAATLDTPVGSLLVVADEDGAILHCSKCKEWQDEPPPWAGASLTMDRFRCERAIEELRAYFEGRLTRFTLPLRPGGTDFQRTVWNALQAIPYGTTITYRELARRVGRPDAARAAGGANAANPIAIIVPCHRVIGSNGSLTGYAGGVEMKRSLLELERRLIPLSSDSFPEALIRI